MPYVKVIPVSLNLLETQACFCKCVAAVWAIMTITTKVLWQHTVIQQVKKTPQKLWYCTINFSHQKPLLIFPYQKPLRILKLILLLGQKYHLRTDSKVSIERNNFSLWGMNNFCLFPTSILTIMLEDSNSGTWKPRTENERSVVQFIT